MTRPQRTFRLSSAIVALLFACALAPAISAHPLAPALLELDEQDSGVVEVLWKRSSLSVPGSNVQPIVPEACPARSNPVFEKQGVAVLARWQIDCGDQGLVGRTIRIDGLGPAKIDTLVRIRLSDGRRVQRVLRRSEPSMVVPAKAKRLAVFRDYLVIGFEHILSGADHLLFVLGLFLLCANAGALIKTVSAFTVGHSITLSFAALGYTHVSSGPIEVLIAASVLVLAVELAREEKESTLMRRHPWPMALVFGLLHGMGFAGALREIGLPGGEIPMALLSFNLGIEFGQLAFVAVLGLCTLALRRMTLAFPTRAAVYVMGSLAAYWTIDRLAQLG